MPRRSPNPDERQRDAERSKQRILDAAVKEFAAKGFAGARVSVIADNAGVNKQLISYYFGGKDGLYAELGRRWWEYEEREIQPETDPVEQIRRYVRASAELSDQARLLAWEGLADQGQSSTAAERDARLKQNNEIFRKARESGELDARFDPDMLGLILLAAASAPTVYPQLVRGVCDADPGSAEFTERFADQLALLVQTLLRSTPDA